MIRIKFVLTFLAVTFVFTVLPAITLAIPNDGNRGGILPSQIVPCDGPDCDLSAFVQLANNIIKFLIGIVVIGSVLVFAFAGFKYMTAQGDESKIKSAHEMFKKVAFGLLVTLTAWLFVDILLSQLTGKGLNEWLGFLNTS